MTPSQNSRQSVKRVLYTQEMSNEGTAEGPQSRGPPKTGFKCLFMKIDPNLVASDSYDYEMELMDRFIQVTKPDEKLVNEMFQAFGTIIAIGIGEEIFVRRCYKWPYERIQGGGDW